MAIVSIPLLGAASGRFADAVFLKLHGKNILRSKKLKRYKPVNPVNLKYQILLTKLITSLSPISYFLKLAYKSKLKHLNYFNYWIKKHYSLFSLSESHYMFCSDITKLSFSTPIFSYNLNASIVSYSGTQLIFHLNTVEKLFDGDYEFIVVLATNNFRQSAINQCSIWDWLNQELIFYYNSPPFESANYHIFLILRRVSDGAFSNTNYLFEFSH